MIPKTFAKLASQLRLDHGIFNDVIEQLTGDNTHVTLAVGGVAALIVPTVWEMVRRYRSRDRQDAEPDLAQARKQVRSIVVDVADARNRAATAALDDALVDLLDEPDWNQFKIRLDDEVRKWCQQRNKGAGNPPHHDEMAHVVLSLIQRVQEVGYLIPFAAHYRQVDSVDHRHRSRIENVFVRLKAERGKGANDLTMRAAEEAEYLDFGSLGAGGIEEWLRQAAAHLVIIGEPGSGKSTMLRYLAAVCAESGSDGPLLPVYLNLRDYAAGQEVLIAESAVNFAEDELQIKIPEGFFKHALYEGRCLVCLDALDEVPKRARHRVVERIEQLAENNPKCVFVVTSRRAGYDEDPLAEPPFKRYTVQSMDDDGIAAFIDWRFGAGSEEAQSVLDTVGNDPNLKTLASNPLQLAMLSLVYRNEQQHELPLKRTEFYQEVVQALIEDRDRDVDPDHVDHTFYTKREKMLAAIAHHLHGEGQETIGRNELQRSVARFLQNDEEISLAPDDARREAAEFVDLAERRVGLLVGERVGLLVGEKVRRVTEFRFLHSTFREYLAAQHIYLSHYTDEPEALCEALWDEIKNLLSDVHWREVILFLLSGFADDEETYCTYLAEKILAAADESREEYEDYEDHEDYAKYELSLLSDYYQQLVADALANQAPMSPEFQEQVIDILGDWARAERYDAFETLLSIRHIPEKVIPVLTDIATGSVFPDFYRAYAAWALSELAAKDEAVKLLTGMVEDLKNDGGARVAAADYLGRLGEGEKAIDALTSIANNSSETTYVRGHAWGALRQLGQIEETRDGLTRVATDIAASVTDRLMAWRELGRFGGSEEAQAVDRIAEIAADQSVAAEYRMYAANEIYLLGDRQRATNFLTAIATDPSTSWDLEDWWTRAVPPLAVDALTAIAKSSSVDVHDDLWAVDALEELGAITALAEVANDVSVDSIVRVMAAGNLRWHGFAESARPALDALTEVGRDENVGPYHRYVAGSTLAVMGETEAATRALDAVASDDEAHARFRINAAEELSRLGETVAATRALVTVASDSGASGTDRIHASEALARLGETEAAESALKSIAEDQSIPEYIRTSASGALEELNQR